MNYKEYSDFLIEQTLLDFKHKMGGNKAAGAQNLKIGERYVDRISLIREIDIELKRIDALQEQASKLQPPDNVVVRELKKVKISLNNSREQLAKTVKTFSSIMTDKTVK